MFSLKELSVLLAISKEAVWKRANKGNWSFELVDGNGGKCKKYGPLSQLPLDIQQAVAKAAAAELAPLPSEKPKPISSTVTAPARMPSRGKGADGLAVMRQQSRVFILYQVEHVYMGEHGLKKTAAIEKLVAELPERAKTDAEYAQALGLFPKISKQTIFEWFVRRAERGGIDGLLDQTGYHRQGKTIIDTTPPLYSCVMACLGQNPNASVEMIRLQMAQQQKKNAEWKGVRLPSYGCLQKWLRRWKSENATTFLAITHPDAYKSRHQMAMGNASGDIERLNQRWELDSTPTDVMLDDNRRHMVIGVIDVYSRRALVTIEKTSSANAILHLLYKAISLWGVPESIKTDNGKDYIASAVQKFCLVLNIRQVRALPFSGEQKPHIERFFHTYLHGLHAYLPGYVGHDVLERQAIRSRKSFADRLMKKGKNIDLPMSVADLEDISDRWLTWYERRHHRGLGGAPADRVAAYTGEVKRLNDASVLRYLLQPVPDKGGVRTIGKKGLQIEKHLYIGAELGAYADHSVHCYWDPEDVARIHVFDGRHTYVGVAVCPDLARLTPDEQRNIAQKGRRIQRETVAGRKKSIAEAAKQTRLASLVDDVAPAIPAPAGVTVTHSTPAVEAAMQAAEAAKKVTALPAPEQKRPILDMHNPRIGVFNIFEAYMIHDYEAGIEEFEYLAFFLAPGSADSDKRAWEFGRKMAIQTYQWDQEKIIAYANRLQEDVTAWIANNKKPALAAG